MKRCPVCESELSEPVPPFCNHCAWDIENDPTLNVMLLPLPDNVLAKYKQKLEIAKKSLQKNQRTSFHQKDVENELRLMHRKVVEVEGYIGIERKKKAENLTQNQEIANQQKEIENELRLMQRKVAEFESYIGDERKKKTENLKKTQELSIGHQQEMENRLSTLIQEKFSEIERRHIEEDQTRAAEIGNLRKIQDEYQQEIENTVLSLISEKFAEMENHTNDGRIEHLRKIQEITDRSKETESEILNIVQQKFSESEDYFETEKKRTEAQEQARASEIVTLKGTYDMAVRRQQEMENRLTTLVQEKFAEIERRIEEERSKNEEKEASEIVNLKKIQSVAIERQEEMENRLLRILEEKFVKVESDIEQEIIRSGEVREMILKADERQKETESEVLSLIQKKFAEVENYFEAEKNRAEAQEQARAAEIENLKKIQDSAIERQQNMENKLLQVLEEKFVKVESDIERKFEFSGEVREMMLKADERRKETESEVLSLIQKKFAEVESYFEAEKNRAEIQAQAGAAEIENLKKIQEMLTEQQKDMENNLMKNIEDKFSRFESYFEAEKNRAEIQAQAGAAEIGNLKKIQEMLTEHQKETENNMLKNIEDKFSRFEGYFEAEKNRAEIQAQAEAAEIGNLKKIQEMLTEHQKETENNLLKNIEDKFSRFECYFEAEKNRAEIQAQAGAAEIENLKKIQEMLTEHQKETENNLLKNIEDKFSRFECYFEAEKNRAEAQEQAREAEIGNLKKIQEMLTEHQKETENNLLKNIEDKFSRFENCIRTEIKEQKQENTIDVRNALEGYIDTAKKLEDGSAKGVDNLLSIFEEKVFKSDCIRIEKEVQEDDPEKELTIAKVRTLFHNVSFMCKFQVLQVKTPDQVVLIGYLASPSCFSETVRSSEIEEWTKKAASASASDEKITCYTKIIELNPKDTQVYFQRGCVYDALGRYDNAIADYSEVIKLDPNFALAYNNRGVAYYNQGKSDKAIADYSQAISLDPNFARAYNNRGAAYYKKGDYDKAMADYSMAIRLDPKYVRAYHNRGNLYKKIGKTELADKDFDLVKKLKKQQR